MKNKMTICSVCGCPVAKTAKVCPHRGVTRRKSMGALAWVGIIAGSLIAVYMLASIILGSTSTQNGAEPAASVAQVTDEPQVDGLFPATQDCGKWNITVTGTTFAKEELLETSDDSRLLAVKTTVINNGKKADYFVLPIGGTITCSVRYKDYKYEHTWLTSVENTVNGQQLNPLEKASGVLLFSIPETVIKDVEEPLYLVFTAGKNTAEFRIRDNRIR